MSETIFKKAYAKINLGLQVLDKRQDLYHNINTIFIKIALYDDIIIENSSRESYSLQPYIPLHSNLIFKAVQLLKSELRLDEVNIKIILNKKIPSGGGLGGGSSDAAATLVGVNDFLNLGLSTAAIQRLAATLGSDVPFFLEESACVGQSRGEILTPVELNLPFTILLIMPGVSVSTAQAYRRLGRGNIKPETLDLESIVSKGLSDHSYLQRHLINDFEPAIFSEYPQLAKIKDMLYNNGAVFALMSGSGSTMYGLFESKETAEVALKNIPYKGFITLPVV